MSNQFQMLLKFIVIGDTGVGKSCVVQQFIQQKINESHDITIGVEFASRIVEIDNKKIKFQIWDTAGQQNFRSITRSYYRSAIGAFLVYDITKKKTFEHAQEWLKQIRNNSSSGLEILLVGNKTDLEDQRQVTLQQGQKLAQSQSLLFHETCAKDYKIVESAFLKLAIKIINKIENGQIIQNTPGVKIFQELKINPLQDNKNKSCC